MSQTTPCRAESVSNDTHTSPNLRDGSSSRPCASFCHTPYGLQIPVHSLPHDIPLNASFYYRSPLMCDENAVPHHRMDGMVLREDSQKLSPVRKVARFDDNTTQTPHTLRRVYTIASEGLFFNAASNPLAPLITSPDNDFGASGSWYEPGTPLRRTQLHDDQTTPHRLCASPALLSPLVNRDAVPQNLIQALERGQLKKFNVHDDNRLDARSPSDECTCLFVGQMPFKIADAKVNWLLRAIGGASKVFCVKPQILPDKKTGQLQHRGCAHVLVRSCEAKAVRNAINCRVKMSADTVFVAADEELFNSFSNEVLFGPEVKVAKRTVTCVVSKGLT